MRHYWGSMRAIATGKVPQSKSFQKKNSTRKRIIEELIRLFTSFQNSIFLKQISKSKGTRKVMKVYVKFENDKERWANFSNVSEKSDQSQTNVKNWEFTRFWRKSLILKKYSSSFLISSGLHNFSYSEFFIWYFIFHMQSKENHLLGISKKF